MSLIINKKNPSGCYKCPQGDSDAGTVDDFIILTVLGKYSCV